MRKLVQQALTLLAAIFANSASANASYIYGFDAISNNNPTNVTIGESQLYVTVQDVGGGSAMLHWLKSATDFD